MTLRRHQTQAGVSDTTFGPSPKPSLSMRMRRHAAIRMIAALAGTFTLVEGTYWLFAIPWSWQAFASFIVRCAAVVWFVLDPELGAFGLIASQIADFIVPYATPVSMLFLSLFAIGAMGYLRPRHGVILAVVLDIGASLNFLMSNDSFMRHGSLITYGVLTIAFLGVGIAMRTVQLRHAQEKSNHAMLRNARMARRLHDYTTNDMSNIIMLSDAVLDAENPSDQLKSVRRIRQNAVDALYQTRAVITTLEDDRAENESTSTPSGYAPGPSQLQQRVSSLVDEQRELLQTLGFEGTVLMPDPLPSTADADADILCGLLRELFGNIARHASPRHGYTLTICANENRCDISMADMPLPAATKVTTIGLGSGLHRYEQEILARHGTWSVTTNQCGWSLHAAIPWTRHGSPSSSVRHQPSHATT